MATKPNVKAEARLESQLRAKSNALKQTDKKYKALQDELNKANSALRQNLAKQLRFYFSLMSTVMS